MTRPAMPWFRLRGSTIEDDDYLAMPLEQQAVYINLLCLACKERPRGSFQVKDLDRLARRVANGRRDVLEATLAYCTSEWQTRTGETTIDKLGRMLGAPVEVAPDATSADASEIISRLSKAYNERQTTGGRRS